MSDQVMIILSVFSELKGTWSHGYNKWVDNLYSLKLHAKNHHNVKQHVKHGMILQEFYRIGKNSNRQLTASNLT